VNEAQKQKRADGLAALGSVSRTADGVYYVTSGVTRGKKRVFEVGRDQDNRVYCNCPEWEESKERFDNGETDVIERCEHILAVKSAIDKGLKINLLDSPPEVTDKEDTKTKMSTIKEKATETTAPAESQPKPVTPSSVDTGCPKTGDWFDDLMAPIPADKIKKREGWRDRNGNAHFVDYIEWHTVVERLNEVCGVSWTFDVELLNDVRCDVPIFKATITVMTGIMPINRSGIGTGKDWSELGVKKGASDALKRAAVNFGIAIDLYKKDLDSDSGDWSGGYQGGGGQQQRQSGGAPANPIAHSLTDLVTAKQLGMIRSVAREAGVDPDDECNKVMRCKTDQLSKKAASSLIQHLQSLPKTDDGMDQTRRGYRNDDIPWEIS